MERQFFSLEFRGPCYISGLRPYAKSISSVILWMQLDYWFRRFPDGFYKFLEPSKNSFYKSGDSWTEELNISSKEFRNAFDNIGIRYNTKSDFEKSTDKFQGKYFCSYFDKDKKLTFYFRNHLLAYKVLDHVARQTTPQGEDTGNLSGAQRESVNLQKGISQVPKGNLYIKALGTTETTTETTTTSNMSSCEKTASPAICTPKSQVREIFEFWKQERKHPKAILDKDRTKKIEWALQNYTPDELRLAIKGVYRSDYHMGRDKKNNPSGKVYDCLTVIFKNSKNIESFIELEERHGKDIGASAPDRPDKYAHLLKT